MGDGSIGGLGGSQNVSSPGLGGGAPLNPGGVGSGGGNPSVAGQMGGALPAVQAGAAEATGAAEKTLGQRILDAILGALKWLGEHFFAPALEGAVEGAKVGLQDVGKNLGAGLRQIGAVAGQYAAEGIKKGMGGAVGAMGGLPPTQEPGTPPEVPTSSSPVSER
jgi:hypothetical protein